jgi:hypothetical protein
MARGDSFRGWAVAIKGDGEARAFPEAPGLGFLHRSGGWAVRILALAEAHGVAHNPQEVLSQALAQVDKTGERWWEAGLHRLRGHFSPSPSPSSSASGVCALHGPPKLLSPGHICARHQQAKSLELRAAESLARSGRAGASAPQPMRYWPKSRLVRRGFRLLTSRTRGFLDELA